MKFSVAFAVASVVVSAAASHAEDEPKMFQIMRQKMKDRQEARGAGLFGGVSTYPDVHHRKKCKKTHGKTGQIGPYHCDNVDLHGFLSHESMGSRTWEGNDIWGWTSPDGREFAAVGQTDGTAFVEVHKRGNLRYLGRLPTQTHNSDWRDIKVIKGYAYIGSEASKHGLQVFDMRKLLDVNPNHPVTFSTTKDLTALFTGFGSSHNIVANEETDMIYAVGTKKHAGCNAGLFMVDVSDPTNPKQVGCAGEDGYVHDAQCVIYKGPTEHLKGREICFNFNEDTLTIVDVTDKSQPRQISRTSYWGASYTHQGWLLDEEMEFLLMDDEDDELKQKGPAASKHTTTYIWNIANLQKPINTGYYQSPRRSIDHNQYIVNYVSYQSNYNSGLRIVNVSTTKTDPSGRGLNQMGFFDSHPEDDDHGLTQYRGSWSVYPFFRSGYILLNGIERGVFSLKYNPK